MKLTILGVLCILAQVKTGYSLISIPLVRHKSGFQLLLEQNTHPKDLARIFAQKNYYNSFGDEKLGPKKNASIKLYKYLQSEYFGHVLIGSPGQEFKMVFDTSMEHSWVTSVFCSPFAYPACAFRNKYDSTKSTTYISLDNEFVITTDRGNITGNIFFDKVHVGDVNVKNQSLIEVEQMSLEEITTLGPDGVLGMGLSGNSKDPMVPFFLNLFRQNLFDLPIFSFYLNRRENTDKGGTLLLGDSNTKHYVGKLTRLPIVDARTWTFGVDRIYVNLVLPFRIKTVTFCLKGCKAFPDTGDVLIYGPKAETKKLNTYLGANYVPYLDRYEVPCSKISILPKVSFSMGGRNFTLDGKDYVQRLMYGPIEICLSAFSELKVQGSNNYWGLGVSFLGKFYSEFDLHRNVVGLADAVV